MKPIVEHVRVSAKGKDILVKIKKKTGLEHWNDICRIALCRSLANPVSPSRTQGIGENALDIEWKTFAGAYSREIIAAVIIRARRDGLPTDSREALAEYFKAHLERGIASMQNIKSLQELAQ